MTFLTPKSLLPKLTCVTLITLGLLSVSMVLPAQTRKYSLLYSDNIKGGSAIFGNTLLNAVRNGSVSTVRMNDNSADGNSIYGNNSENMRFVDIDGATGNGSVTANSSSSDLILPAGTNTIKLARLYWGGVVKNSEYNLSADSSNKVKIRKGTSASYSGVVTLGIDKVTNLGGSLDTSYTQYQAYADITSFVQSNGAGTYEVGNVPLSQGTIGQNGYGGGWYIVVVYENTSLNFSSVRVYDGFEQVKSNNTSSTLVTLTGLNVPSGAMASGDAKMGVVCWEGDANIKEDFFKINGNLFSNATNPADNPWNGTITNNGVHVTTKNPDYTNQMSLDIDQFDIGTGYNISPNDNSINLEFGTNVDGYFPGLFTFTIKVKDPAITINKSVADSNNNHLAEKNEVLTYNLKGKNAGPGNAGSIVITDTLPSSVTYVPNSLKVISSPGVTAGIKTDASADDNAEYIVNGSIKTVRFRLGTGSTGSLGGTLAPNESYEVEFKVAVNDPGAGHMVPSIVNIARIKAVSDANVNFVDDGTAIINPENGTTPVTLISFNGTLLQQNKVKIDWSTAMEINCSQYTVERSLDGKTFYAVATVPGSGTTNSFHSYSITDDVSSAAGSIVYYRLKQTDVDNKQNYSKVIAIKLKSLNTQINISPNPFTSYLNVNMEWNNSEIITVKVLDVQGKEVISKNIQMSKGLNYISIGELSKLNSGNYYMEFISSNGTTTKKISKQ